MNEPIKYMTKEEFLEFVKKTPKSVFTSEHNLKYFKKVYDAKKKYGGDYSKEEKFLRENGVDLDE